MIESSISDVSKPKFKLFYWSQFVKNDQQMQPFSLNAKASLIHVIEQPVQFLSFEEFHIVDGHPNGILNAISLKQQDVVDPIDLELCFEGVHIVVTWHHSPNQFVVP